MRFSSVAPSITVFNIPGQVGGSLDYFSIPTLAYEDRAQLKELVPSEYATYVVSGLGLFVWYSGLETLDDDETAFPTTNGSWVLEAPTWDYIEANLYPILGIIQQDISYVSGKFIQYKLESAISSISATTQVSFTAPVVGARLGDNVIVNPPNTLGLLLTYFARVTSADEVTIFLNNPSGGVETVTPGTWDITVITGDS